VTSYAAQICFALLEGSLSITLVILRGYAWVTGRKERTLGLWLGHTSPAHISILFL